MTTRGILTCYLIVDVFDVLMLINVKRIFYKFDLDKLGIFLWFYWSKNSDLK